MNFAARCSLALLLLAGAGCGRISFAELDAHDGSLDGDAELVDGGADAASDVNDDGSDDGSIDAADDVDVLDAEVEDVGLDATDASPEDAMDAGQDADVVVPTCDPPACPDGVGGCVADLDVVPGTCLLCSAGSLTDDDGSCSSGEQCSGGRCQPCGPTLCVDPTGRCMGAGQLDETCWRCEPPDLIADDALCSPGDTCLDGACRPACDAPRCDTGSECVDELTPLGDCLVCMGGSFVDDDGRCAASEVCSGGACGPACPSPSCVSPTTLECVAEGLDSFGNVPSSPSCSVCSVGAFMDDASICGGFACVGGQCQTPYCASPPGHCTALPTYGTPTRSRVLLVGDDLAAWRYECLLRDAGHAVDLIAYEDMLPAASDLGTYAAVVILDGYLWQDRNLSASAEAALVEYVRAGGGLVTTEWVLWHSGYSTLHTILPVTFDSWSGGATRTFVIRDAHPITDETPSSFVVQPHGFSTGAPAEGATVLLEDSTGLPTLATHAEGSGRVAWFGVANDYACFDWLGNPELTVLFVRAVSWTAGEASLPSVDGNSAGARCACARPDL